MNIQEAEQLLQEFVKSESLLRHCRSVACSMLYFARKLGEDPRHGEIDEEKWYVTGLLHDFDYEMYPEEHPMKGEGILRERGVSEDVVRAIQSHAQYTGVSRDSLMEKYLFAVDELSGFVVAVAWVRPDRLAGMSVKSVKKKLKDKQFAAAVSRDDIREGAEALGVELDELIAGVIAAQQEGLEL